MPDSKLIIVSNGWSTAILLNGQCVGSGCTNFSFSHDTREGAKFSFGEIELRRVAPKTEDEFWKNAENILGYKLRPEG